ncbi:hypothetical protein OAO94_01605 [Flavobacteriaceae bacterium]|nr:hypothetical protein [Flavobacteriaceae bacterium]
MYLYLKSLLWKIHLVVVPVNLVKMEIVKHAPVLLVPQKIVIAAN